MDRSNGILNKICCCFKIKAQAQESQNKKSINFKQKSQLSPNSAQNFNCQQIENQINEVQEKSLKPKRVFQNQKLKEMSQSYKNQKLISQKKAKNYIDQNDQNDHSFKCLHKKQDKSIEKDDLPNVNATSSVTSNNMTIKTKVTQAGSQIKSKSLIDCSQIKSKSLINLLQKSNFQISCQPSKRNTATTQHANNKKAQQPNIKKTIKYKDGDDLEFTFGNEKKQYTKKSKQSFFYQVQISEKERSRKRRKLVAKIFQKKQFPQQTQQTLFYQKMMNTSPQHKKNLINILKCFQLQNNHINDLKKWEGIVMQQGQKTLSSYLKQKLKKIFQQHQYKDYMREVKLIVLSILNGLMQMLDLGFVHKDIKPQNIVLIFNQQGNKAQVKIIDFGTVCEIDQSNKENQEKYKGTQYYMAPQLLLRNPIQVKKLDSFSLGQVMFQMLLGKDQTFFKQIRRRQEKQKLEVLNLLKNIYQNQKQYQRYKKRLVDLIPTMHLPNSLIFTCIKLIELKKQDRFNIEQAHKLMNTLAFSLIFRQQIQNLKISQNNVSLQTVNQINELMLGIRTNLLQQQQKIQFNFFLYLCMMTYYNFEKNEHKKKYNDLEKQLKLQDKSISNINQNYQKMQQQKQQKRKQNNGKFYQLQKEQIKDKQYKQYMDCYLCYSLLKSNMFFQQKYLLQSWKYFFFYRQDVSLQNEVMSIEKFKMKFTIPERIKQFFVQLLNPKKTSEQLYKQVVSTCYQKLDHEQIKQCLKNYLKALIAIKQQQQNNLVDLLYIQSLRNFCTLILKSCKKSCEHYLQNRAGLDQVFKTYKGKNVLLKEEVFSFLLKYLE